MEREILGGMHTDPTYPERFAAAVADVVEQARWEARIGSIRELAGLSGMTHTALNARKAYKTPYTVRDLAALAPALKIEPVEILRRARLLLEAVDAPAGEREKLLTLAERRAQRETPGLEQEAARPKKRKPKMGEDD